MAEIDALAQALRAGADAERQRLQEHVLRVMAQQQEALVKQSEARLKRVLDQLFVFVGVLDARRPSGGGQRHSAAPRGHSLAAT